MVFAQVRIVAGETRPGNRGTVVPTEPIGNMKKTYTHVPPAKTPTRVERLTRVVAGAALFPIYWLGARPFGLPGLGFGIDSFRLGLRSLPNKKDDVSYAEIYRMLFAPIESTRYIEFGLAWDFVSDIAIGRYLDVSSPRLFPLALMRRRKGAVADLINPDPEDLKTTAQLVGTCGFVNRCTLSDRLIQELPLDCNTFDLITSLSVVEHIPEDTRAVRRMWELLKPGGRLVMSVPCAAIAEEQYIDVNHYGLQRPDENGFVFLQYVYDAALLQERFYKVLGEPARHSVYGERVPGSLRSGFIKKWSGEYPRWKEPYIMARGFQRYETVSDLPGEGVIVMEFKKG